ncbi:26S proteasome non-ATPase regulatory subunit 5 [Holothuria leucospilota]|uniref:26S proteasome non-ATPase regulatory subunit 5 n=1 Tax=Holothuria leucospilota TaxID=206669 RepID=A0A9Q1C7H6_HOLLE|nr:26S proteasome non-ATPase regulatory subunit 5 [Holothuria leucospilota]
MYAELLFVVGWNGEALEVGVDILSRLLDCLDPTVVLAQLRDELYMGMGHPHERIRQVCIHQIERLVDDEVGLNNLKNDSEMLANVISTVADESLAVSKLSMKSLIAVGKDPAGASQLFEGPLQPQMIRVAATNETIRYRVFEEMKRRKRGRAGGVKKRMKQCGNRPYLPTIIMGNVQSLCNKMDELCGSVKYLSDFRNASILSFTETWLTDNHTDDCVSVDGFKIIRGDRDLEAAGKRSGGATSLPALEKVNRSGLLGQLLSDLHTEDDLVQLNAIEMLCALVDSPHGIVFLEKEGVLRKMEEMLVEAEADPSQGFLLPELVKFFGILSRHQPKELSEKYPAFLQCCFHLLESCETSLLNIAVETIGFVGSSTDGKRALNKQGMVDVDHLDIHGRGIVHPREAHPGPTNRSQSEGAVSTGMSLLSSGKVTKEQLNEDLEGMLQQWFEQVSTKPMDLILSLCQQPFLEIRCPALSILQALCDHKWAQTQLLNRPGFQEYLLDRSTEHEKIGKESKYAVVKALAEAYHTGEIFGRPYLLKLREYVRDGPFYVQTQSEVVVEGNR